VSIQPKLIKNREKGIIDDTGKGPFPCAETVFWIERMNDMKRILATTLKFLATGTVTLFMAACYGVASLYKHITAKTAAGDPIQGLQATLLVDSVEDSLPKTTDADGGVGFTVMQWDEERASVKIEDLDDAGNLGNFETQTIDVSSGTEFNVTMEAKN